MVCISSKVMRMTAIRRLEVQILKDEHTHKPLLLFGLKFHITFNVTQLAWIAIELKNTSEFLSSEPFSLSVFLFHLNTFSSFTKIVSKLSKILGCYGISLTSETTVKVSVNSMVN